MSTTDRAAEIRARLNAATPGPWHEGGEGDIRVDDYTIAEIWGLKSTGDSALIANAPADLAWLLDEVKYWAARAERDEAKYFRDFDQLSEKLEAAEARAAAAEARLERAQKGQSAFWDDLSRDLEDPEYRAHFEQVSAEIEETDRLTRQLRVKATAPDESPWPPPARSFTALFPETDEHRSINDEAATRLLEDEQ